MLICNRVLSHLVFLSLFLVYVLSDAGFIEAVTVSTLFIVPTLVDMLYFITPILYASLLLGASVLFNFGPRTTLPDDFTICSMTRYTGANRQRILTNTGTTCDWSHGHRAAKRGVAFYSALRTLDLSFGTPTDWLVMCGQNSQSNLDANPRNIIADGINSFFVCLHSMKSSQINYFFRNCSW